jgi:hypothetical protein
MITALQIILQQQPSRLSNIDCVTLQLTRGQNSIPPSHYLSAVSFPQIGERQERHGRVHLFPVNKRDTTDHSE